MKYKLKDKVNAKGRVAYKAKGRSGMAKVILGDATQKQLAELHAIGHPFIEEVKNK